MRGILKTVSDLTVSSLAVLALLGLLVPAQVFAQAGWTPHDAGPARSFHIEVLEMSADNSRPSRFVLTGHGQTLRFELDAEGYRWHDTRNRDRFGHLALLDAEARGQAWASLSSDGALRGQIPVSQLGSPAIESGTRLASAGALATPMSHEAMAEIVGGVGDKEGTFALSVLVPGEPNIDLTVSAAPWMAGAPSGSELLANGAAVGQAVIHIPWGILLSILIRVSCAAIHSVCFWACNQVCGGVATVETAACGVGCTCLCE